MTSGLPVAAAAMRLALRVLRPDRAGARLRWAAIGGLVALLRIDLALADPPWAEPGETPIALEPIPATTAIGDHRVTIRAPGDPELTTLGGSGGPILELGVSRGADFHFEPTTIQAIWLNARIDARGSLVFSSWSKTGVSSYVQCRLEPQDGRYCVAWCQDHEVDEESIRAIGDRRAQPDCEALRLRDAEPNATVAPR